MCTRQQVTSKATGFDIMFVVVVVSSDTVSGTAAGTDGFPLATQLCDMYGDGRERAGDKV